MQNGAPFEGNSTLEPSWSLGAYNQDLTWEETDQYDFGLDLDLLDYRLGITLDYYYRYTDKLLFPCPYRENTTVSVPSGKMLLPFQMKELNC